MYIVPPTRPLYPEPQPLGQGRYMLDQSTYTSHLPPKFHTVDHAATKPENAEVVVVEANGGLKVEPRARFTQPSQFTRFDGYGRRRIDGPQSVHSIMSKGQGPGRRWSYLPWTREQEQSCKQEEQQQPTKLYLKLRLNPKPKRGNKGKSKGGNISDNLK